MIATGRLQVPNKEASPSRGEATSKTFPYRASAFRPASLMRRRAMAGAPRLPGRRTRSVVASQATRRRDAAAVTRHERHRVTVRCVGCGPDGEKPDRLCALQGRDERAHFAAAFRAVCIFRPASCSEFGLFRCEGNARPRVHLYACDERVAAILGTEDRCLTLSHIEPVLAETIDDVWLMGDENGVGAGLR
jgi:hypothetical protein